MADGKDAAARVAAVIVTHNSGHVVERCHASLGDVEKVIVVGNGGSAAIASHVSVDLTKAAGIRAINFNLL